MEFFLCVVGMVLFIEGLPYAAFPKQVKKMIGSMMAMPLKPLRVLGLALMMAGLCLVYLGRR